VVVLGRFRCFHSARCDTVIAFFPRYVLLFRGGTHLNFPLLGTVCYHCSVGPPPLELRRGGGVTVSALFASHLS